MEQEEIVFLEEWLPLDKTYFRILAVVSVLADRKLAFRGTINDLCNEIGIGASTTNKNNIKSSLKYLEENGFIKVIYDGSVITVSLAAAVEKSPNIKKIRRAWYHLIREAECEASWEPMLKVFLYLIDIKADDPISYQEIGEQLNISKTVVGRCVKAIKGIEFLEDNMIMRIIPTKENVKVGDGRYVCVGQKYLGGLEFKQK